VSRPCSACDGEGFFVIRCCGGTCSDGGARFEECEACEGMGRVEDRIPARDAELDAETLELLVSVPRRLLSARRRRLADNLITAAYALPAEWLRDPAFSGFMAARAEDARKAARAAFRAVPLLRAE
jgi:hypothetical protein